jgi:hypothetical protein
MRVLRAYYLRAYLSSIKPPYTSDPLPPPSTASPSYPTSSTQAPFHAASPTVAQVSSKRETTVLDAYCALRALDDFRRFETSFHPDFTDCYADLFSHAQPRQRLVDLVLARTHDLLSVHELDPRRLSVVLIPKLARLVLARQGGERRTIAEESIEKGQTLESVAAALARRLERGLREGIAQ